MRRTTALTLSVVLVIAATAGATRLSNTPLWTSTTTDDATSLAIGDYDLDGWLDMVVGTTRDTPLRLYRNVEGDLQLAWSSLEVDETRGVAWADVDRDGDLDLAVANSGPNRLYRNDAGTLALAWTSAESNDSTGVAWADYDGDGDLDLAVSNRGAEPNQLYRNDAGTLVLAWTSAEFDDSQALAWGYLDDDALPDLAIANDGQPNRVYRSTGTDLLLVWSAAAPRATRDLAWGDLDANGTLDLVVVNDGEPLQEYHNQAGVLTLAAESTETPAARCVAVVERGGDSEIGYAVGTAAGEAIWFFSRLPVLPWQSPLLESTRDCAWADLDHDGDLDLAVVNDDGDPSRVYEDSWILHNGWWSSFDLPVGFSGGSEVALADWDCDGDLDVAATGFATGITGNPIYNPTHVFTNNGRFAPFSLAWESAERHRSTSLAWGDWDGDADLDLATGSTDAPIHVYENDGAGGMALAWSAPSTEEIRTIAWGDVDGDGDLDLAAAGGGVISIPVRLYANDGARNLSLAWSSPSSHVALGIEWGDFEGDGDIDLAVATFREPNLVYTNAGGVLAPGWSTPEVEDSLDVAWGDWDGDGLLDLAVANDLADRIYRNLGGGTMALAWTAPLALRGYDVAWADWDDDGDLDLGVGDGLGYRVYRNRGGAMVEALVRSLFSAHESIAWGDLDDDGDLELSTTTRNDHGSTVHGFIPTAQRPRADTPETAGFPVIGSRPGATGSGFFHSSAEILGSPVLLHYALFDREGDPVPRLTAEYSPNGGGFWLPATPATGGDGLTDLTTSSTGAGHVFAWDAAADGVVSDAVVLRLAFPQIPSRIGGPIAHATQAALSPPFRVNGALPGNAPTTCLTVRGACLTTALRAAESLTVVKEPGGARLRWADDPSVTRYHVNSVSVKTDLVADGPHRPARGGASAQCDVTDRSASCLDGDAWSDGVDLLFYRVMASCGADGFDEGPP